MIPAWVAQVLKPCDILLRGLPFEVADKPKVATSLHRIPMKEYIRRVLGAHLRELEWKRITLTLPKGAR
jgi:hypothetical protein